MEKKVILYMHAGSGNHGCEAIVNSLCHMIEEKPLLLSYFGQEDESYSLGELCKIVEERSFSHHKLAHLFYYGWRLLTGDKESFIRFRYHRVLKEKDIPLAVSIGGDNYCYDNMLNDLRLSNAAFNRKGIKTVLLGCSIEPALLEKGTLTEDLSAYHTIIAREPLTYQALQRVFEQQAKDHPESRIPSLLCLPDPAFTLTAKELPLPEGFAEGNTVGVNISPMIQENERKTGIALECYENMIQYIIDHTSMQIALIPHVIWERSDDRKPIHVLYEKFRHTGRVVEMGDASCQELKGYIGRCRFFVGARTHATIAAYSSCVPTLVVGYSVKARGIARELFGQEENYVIPVQSLESPEDLTKGFVWLLEREAEIKGALEKSMPEYQSRAMEIGREVDGLWEELNRQSEI